MKEIDIDNGIRFKCQGSSNCCVSRGNYGFVYLSKKDIKNLSIFFKLSSKNFIKLYCQTTDGFTYLKERTKKKDCQFLKKKRCSVYKARPIQCRTWPFWSENMNTKSWNKEITKFCPGIGRGKVISKKEIEKKILEDDKNEIQMLKEI